MIVTGGDDDESPKRELEGQQESEPELGENQTEPKLLHESSSPNIPHEAPKAPAASQKRRSSWRNLLSPSYKSRSEEFHRLFADELPRSERLLADYSCALHREILLQGRLYVSLNHLAFYSNIFSWVTKLVIRLENIRDIYKANTAKIIPNAIQVITDQGDKHVFASLIARDKTFLLIKRIWLSERLSDQELRRLVHLGYGKDLGFGSSDLDEAQMLMSTSSSLSSASSNTSPVSCNDSNNNSNNSERGQPTKTKRALRMRFKSRSQTQKEVLSLIQEHEDKSLPAELGRSPGSKPVASQKARRAGASRRQSERVVRHLSMRFANLSSFSYHDEAFDHTSREQADASEQVAAAPEDQLRTEPDGRSEGDEAEPQNISTSTASSAVVLDTPILVAASRTRRALALDPAELEAAEGPEQTGGRAEQSPAELAAAAAQQQAAGTPPACASGPHQLEPNKQPELVSVNNAEADELTSDEANSGVECGCDEHAGTLLIDEQFDINVDLLFSLIFTNSKFMRAHMIKRGMTRSLISKWRRSSPGSSQLVSGGETEAKASAGADNNGNGGTRSSSSTLSSRDGATGQAQACQAPGQRTRQNSLDSLRALDKQAAKVRSEQERQLSYSMDVNHVLVKTVEVEERQSICLARSGQVYVLKSTTLNSGFPYSESFTIDLHYCLTRGETRHRSRMQVHALVNFIKEKNNWRLSMIKPMLEKNSMQGTQEFIADLSQSVRQFASSQLAAYSRRKAQRRSEAAGTPLQDAAGQEQQQQVAAAGELSQRQQREPPDGGEIATDRDETATPTEGQRGGGAARDNRSLTRAKSKLKERKLRHMYRYYIRAGGAGEELQRDEISSGGCPARSLRRAGRDELRGGVAQSCPASAADDFNLSSSSSASSTSSSSDSSSLLCDEVGHDNDSMLIMMATTNDDDDLENPKAATSKAGSASRRLAPGSDHLLASNQRRAAEASRPRKHPNAGSYATKNLVMALGGGLLLLLTGAVFVLNALVLRRLDRLELTMRTILDQSQ